MSPSNSFLKMKQLNSNTDSVSAIAIKKPPIIGRFLLLVNKIKLIFEFVLENLKDFFEGSLVVN